MTHLLEFSLHLVLSLFYILFILLKSFDLFLVTLCLHCTGFSPVVSSGATLPSGLTAFRCSGCFIAEQKF